MALTQKIRRLILALFIAAFLCIAPLLLLYTAGYRYNWVKRRVEQTGVLSIDVLPRDSRVFLNGIRLNKELPIRLANRSPGTYKLRIEKDGYRPWEKDITIESKRSSYIKNVTLFREALPTLTIPDDAGRMQAAIPSPSGAFLVMVSASNGVYDVELLNAQTDERTLIARTSAAAPPRIHWSPFDEVGVIEIRSEAGATLQFFDGTGVSGRTHAFPKRREEDAAQWVKNALLPTLAVAEEGNVRTITAETTGLIATIKAGAIWYLRNDNALWLNDPERHAVFPASTPADAISYPATASLNAIIDMNDARLLLDTSLGIIVRRLQPLAEETIPGMSVLYRASTEEWLVWSPWELWAAYKDGSAALLNRTSEETRWVFPMDEYGVLLLGTPQTLTAFNPGYYVSHELFRGGEIEAVSVEKKTRRIYFLGTVGSRRGLYTLEF